MNCLMLMNLCALSFFFLKLCTLTPSKVHTIFHKGLMEISNSREHYGLNLGVAPITRYGIHRSRSVIGTRTEREIEIKLEKGEKD